MRKITLVVAKFITSFMLIFGGVTAPALSTGCKPTYIDPVTGDEVACSTLPQADLDYVLNLGLELALLIPDWGAIQRRAISEGVVRGGCAIAALVDKFLAPPPGIAVPPPEQSIAARESLEAVRANFGGKVSWVNAKGQAL